MCVSSLFISFPFLLRQSGFGFPGHAGFLDLDLRPGSERSDRAFSWMRARMQGGCVLTLPRRMAILAGATPIAKFPEEVRPGPSGA